MAMDESGYAMKPLTPPEGTIFKMKVVHTPTLEERVKYLEDRVMELERKDFHRGPIGPTQPFMPMVFPNTGYPRCSKCGIQLNGVMGYVCSHADCPTGIGPIMC